MDPSFDMHDFSTTTAPDDESDWPLWTYTLIWILTVILTLICSIFCKDKDNASWDALSDFNTIRSDFKSINSLKQYLSDQTTSKKMNITILYLIIVIILNTYTNVKACDHYKGQNMHDPDDDLLLYGVKMMSGVEMALSIGMIISPLICYFRKYYATSVHCAIIIAPNVSALCWFALYAIRAVKMAKKKIFCILDSKKSICAKSRNCLKYMTGLIVYAAIGILLFVLKVNQIKYIYDKNREALTVADYIVVVGTARQFASLHSMSESMHCWNFVYGTEHPIRRNENKDGDPDWYTKFDADKVVCSEMVKKHGFWGYCWLCYTFNDLENVKKMYLQYQEPEPIQHGQYLSLN
eukprot:159951_1